MRHPCVLVLICRRAGHHFIVNCLASSSSIGVAIVLATLKYFMVATALGPCGVLLRSSSLRSLVAVKLDGRDILVVKHPLVPLHKHLTLAAGIVSQLHISKSFTLAELDSSLAVPR